MPPAKTTLESRCPWSLSDPLMQEYHDKEWGRPVHDDGIFFEFRILEGAQAGLSWRTILIRREGYREAFAGFDPVEIARFGPRQVEALMQNAGIIRNRLKIEGTIKNARAFLALQQELGGFSPYVWSFVGGAPMERRPKSGEPLRATSPESDALSKDLKKRGFTFVGSTICYAFMQATGLVNDHIRGCPAGDLCSGAAGKAARKHR